VGLQGAARALERAAAGGGNGRDRLQPYQSTRWSGEQSTKFTSDRIVAGTLAVGTIVFLGGLVRLLTLPFL